ncbi:hypothetical protein BLA18112_07609 [Burkholderia lata]|uniref:Uncharacterized protein n=1 Tax=Burkholderia lata (strain ATCC 17760 / DSM 23089 / LMG 22485 / NCIMB 9086 / R18194 / 383) TaxID=482957 RepID=A0A6P3B941_BURL3|nr:hypothetical protein BLA18112_07609 [Burkholderia lata]
MDPECGARAEEASGGRPAAGTAAGARLTYNTPKNTWSGAAALATAKRRPARAPRQATAATLSRDGETSGTSNTS